MVNHRLMLSLRCLVVFALFIDSHVTRTSLDNVVGDVHLWGIHLEKRLGVYVLEINEFIVSRDVSFDEIVFPYQLREGEVSVTPGPVITEFVDEEPELIPSLENDAVDVIQGTEVPVVTSEGTTQQVNDEAVAPIDNPNIRGEEVTQPTRHNHHKTHVPVLFDDYGLYNTKAHDP